MHLPLLKALIAVISAAVVAVGVALAPTGQSVRHVHGSAAATRTGTLERDGLVFLGQLAEGNVKPDPTLEHVWTDDVTAVAHTLGLSDRALADQLNAGRSLSQIAATQGVPTSTVTTVLMSHIRDDLNRAEQDQAVSPTVARALVNALGTALGNP